MSLDRNAAIGSIDDLLSKNLDDLDDLPSFETPPVGAYVLSVTTEQKEINGKHAIEAKFTVKETVELKDPQMKAVAEGTQFSTLFTLNEFGVGKLKEFCVPFAEHFGEKNVGTLVRDTIKDVTISAYVGNRKDKEDPEKVYATVKVLSIA